MSVVGFQLAVSRKASYSLVAVGHAKGSVRGQRVLRTDHREPTHSRWRMDGTLPGRVVSRQFSVVSEQADTLSVLIATPPIRFGEWMGHPAVDGKVSAGAGRWERENV